ncbi:MAG: FixH family protein [Rickettsiales bacterium]|nr:FixH family protein [Rickettsiales bacterium]
MTGKQVWWYFVAFFGFVATINAVMVTLAIRTHSGMVTDHPYEKGLAYNRIVEAEQKQEAQGWKGRIDYHDNILSFMLRDKNNRSLSAEKMTATVTRPTQQGMDFSMELKSEETRIDFPQKGLWEVRVDALHNGVHYQQSKRIVVE